MYLYTTKNGKLEGMQECSKWTLGEVLDLSAALEHTGKKLIVINHGLSVCGACKRILKANTMAKGGEIDYGYCPGCIGEGFGRDSRHLH